MRMHKAPHLDLCARARVCVCACMQETHVHFGNFSNLCLEMGHIKQMFLHLLKGPCVF